MKVLAMILAGGVGSRLDLLSKERSKPSVPFAGKYRIIDFCLSNLENSGIFNCAVLTQYKPLSLIEHIGNGKPWDFDRRDTYITILQPYKNWYMGTADAILQNIDFVERIQPDYILILSGDHIYTMDYRPMIEQHIKTHSDLTIGAIEVDPKEVSRFGILNCDKDKNIIDFVEKPAKSTSTLASMGIYVFSYQALRDMLLNTKKSNLDFGQHIIPLMIEDKKYKVKSYYFNGYWQDVGTYDSFMEANLSIATKKSELKLDDPNWIIHTRSLDMCPVQIGENAKIKNSLLSHGSTIEGTVENCIIGLGVHIGKNAVVKNSILFNESCIGENTELDNCIIDRKVKIGKNCSLGVKGEIVPNKEKPSILNSGITVVERKASIPDNVEIGKNCRILFKSSFKGIKVVPSGTTIGEE